jgi:tetratricopeptide (TPR) repeat protein
VFRGGCTLAAAEEVCDADIDTLASLLDKSLVRHRAGSEGQDLYWMLETIREFASERLEGSGEADDVRRRHAQRVLVLARGANMSSDHFALESSYERVYAELEDVRAALDWAASQDPALGAEIFASLEQLWATHSHSEGRQRADALLEHASALPPDLRARVLRTSGGIVFQDGEFDLGETRYREALELFDELGDEQSAVGLRARFAVHAGFAGDPETARRLVAEVRSLNDSVGNPVVEPQMLSTLGDLAFKERDWERARELYLRSIDIATECGFTLWELWTLTSLLEVDLERNAPDDAERSGRRALEVSRRLRDREYGAYILAGLARAALQRGASERAGILWGAVTEDLREDPLGRLALFFDEFAAPLLEVTDAGFLAAVEDGRLRGLEEAVAIALGEVEAAQTVP